MEGKNITSISLLIKKKSLKKLKVNVAYDLLENRVNTYVYNPKVSEKQIVDDIKHVRVGSCDVCSPSKETILQRVEVIHNSYIIQYLNLLLFLR